MRKRETYKESNYKTEIEMPTEIVYELKELMRQRGTSMTKLMYQELTKIYPHKKGK